MVQYTKRRVSPSEIRAVAELATDKSNLDA